MGNMSQRSGSSRDQEAVVKAVEVMIVRNKEEPEGLRRIRDLKIGRGTRRWRNEITTRGTGKQKIQVKWQKLKGSLCWVRASRTSNFTRHHDFKENLRG